MKKSVFILLMFVFCPLVADQDAEAYRLLKSWGMQYDSKGNLHFRPQQQTADAGAKPWKPEIPVYQASSKQPTSQFLKPLVISSKQAAEK